MNVAGTMSEMLVLLAVTAVGFLAAKLGYVDDHVKDKLTQLLLNITLPCMVLASVGDMDAASAGSQIAWAFGLAALLFPLSLAAGALCNVALRTPRGQRRLYLFMSVCTNTGFIGIAVVTAIYGMGTALLCSIFVMVLSLLMYSVGFALIAPAEEGGRGIPWKAMANPAMASCVAALALFFLGVHLPGVVQESLGMVGGVTAPVAMMLVGVTVAGMRLRDVAREWRLYPFIVVRQLVVPAALFLALRPVVPDGLVLAVAVIMCSMPVGSMAAMFAGQLGQDERLPAKGTILSTVASFAVLPALAVLMAVA